MSYEMIGILVLGLGQVIGVVVSVRGFREISRIQRALAGLIVQESERLQALIRRA